jgi:hypothetical protein
MTVLVVYRTVNVCFNVGIGILPRSEIIPVLTRDRQSPLREFQVGGMMGLRVSALGYVAG